MIPYKKTNLVYKNRLCVQKLSLRGDVFFSLADYKNNYFMSKHPDKVLEFYSSFSSRVELINWMKERPEGISELIEVKGRSDIVVVIPTSDFNGKYAKECRENIFKGLHIIFVESGGVEDFYFNSAHNVNLGINKAFEYNPKWIVFSGDDMIKESPVENLIQMLNNLNPNNIDVVFTLPRLYHSTPMSLYIPNRLFPIIVYLLGLLFSRYYYIYQTYKTLKKFNKITYFPVRTYNINVIKKIGTLLLFKTKIKFLNVLSFGIFSSKFLQTQGKLFDELYINEMDDTDLSINIKTKANFLISDGYQINEYIGSTLGTGPLRTLRVVPSFVYFSAKVEKNEINI